MTKSGSGNSPAKPLASKNSEISVSVDKVSPTKPEEKKPTARRTYTRMFGGLGRRDKSKGADGKV
jgi:hypothetical protein